MAPKLKILNILNALTAVLAVSFRQSVQAVPSQDQLTASLKTNPIVKDLNLIVATLSGVVGLVIIGSLIFGGIQYIMAGSSPEAIGKAKKRIYDSILALFVFMFFFALLQWLIPGGL